MTERTYGPHTSALSSFKELPEDESGLTGVEMAAMKQFSVNHYSKHPRASQREVKRAMQRHFKVQIVRS
jgi:hypothetical protein